MQMIKAKQANKMTQKLNLLIIFFEFCELSKTFNIFNAVKNTENLAVSLFKFTNFERFIQLPFQKETK